VNQKSVLGEILPAAEVISGGYSQQSTRRIMAMLAFCVALMMTGFGIIMPVFARRLSEFGSGVEALGYMTMAFALAQFVAAPFMGSLADRYGRRPLIIIGLLAFATANVGFLFAASTNVFILVRLLEGAFTAGIFPAAMGMVSDIAPEEQRARWAGILMGSYGAGFILGPVLGGFLYDRWGFAMPFIASAVMATLAIIAALIVLPETHTPAIRKRDRLLKQREDTHRESGAQSIIDTLPKPLYILLTLLLVDFMIVFTFAFVEPEMVFYFYDQLGWSTVQFGIIVGVYGLSMVIGQWLLGPLSDRFARKPVIVIGLFLNASLYIGLAAITNFYIMLGIAALAGVGEALMMPSLSAYYIDISDKRYRARILGFKESAASLGGVVGPLSIALVSALLTSQIVFIIAFVFMIIAAITALFILKEPRHEHKPSADVDQSLSRNRSLAAQAVYSGIVLNASTVRKVDRLT